MGWRDGYGNWHYDQDEAPEKDPGNQNQFRDDSGLGQYVPGVLGVSRWQDTPAQPDQPYWGDLKKQTSAEYGGAQGVAGQEEQRYGGLAAAADARPAVQANLGSFYGDMGAAGSGAQDYGADYYKRVLYGQMTPADLQMQQGMQAGLAQTGSQVAGARGGGNALVAAQSAGADAAARQTGAYQGALARLQAQERMQAIQGLGDAATARRQQDLQATGMYGDAAYRQAQLAQQSQAQNDQRNLYYEGKRRDVFNDQLALQQQAEKNNADAFYKRKAASDDWRQKDQQQATQEYQGAAQAAATMLVSDVRAKKNIVPAGAKVDQALDAMSPFGYQYKQPEKYGRGEQVGPMAQELAATPAGRTAVAKMPDGKLAIDQGQATKLSLAAAARLNERLRALEASSPIAAPMARDYAAGGAGGMLAGAYHANPAVVDAAAKDAAINTTGPAYIAVDQVRQHPEARGYIWGGLPGAAANYLRRGR